MNKTEKEQFNRMIEASFKKKSILEIGTKFQAKVISYNQDYIFIQVLEAKGTKGILWRNEFDLIPKIGSVIEVFFVKESHGNFYFTNCMYENITMDSLRLAFDFNIPVWGKIQSRQEEGYKVKIAGTDTFCPKNQLKIDNQDKIVGKKFKFIIIRIAKNQILVSQKSFQEREKEIKKLILKKELKENMFVDCRIVSILSFGLLVDIDGINGLIPAMEASFKRKPDLQQEFKIGQMLKAKILSLNWEENKHTLTIKDFLDDPWLKTLPCKEQSIVKGKIEKIESFGLFVKLDEYFTGLVPLRETNIDVRTPLYQFFKKQQEIEVAVLEINPEKKKLLLSIKKAKELKERMEYQQYLTEVKSEEGYSLGDILKKKLGS